MPIILFTQNNTKTCRKVREWLAEKDVSYVERNIVKEPLNTSEIRYLLKRCGEIKDLINIDSQFLKSVSRSVYDLPLSFMVQSIEDHPDLLKNPIMLSENIMLSGYDSLEMSALLPKTKRMTKNPAFPSGKPLPQRAAFHTHRVHVA